MADTERRTAAAALDECERIVTRLDKMCCDPGRSPSMNRLKDTLSEIRTQLDDDAELDSVLTSLEDAGSQIGRLQVGCCAPARMPLYADTLVGLTDIQLAVKKAAGKGH